MLCDLVEDGEVATRRLFMCSYITALLTSFYCHCRRHVTNIGLRQELLSLENIQLIW